jgi:hypothetical protein
MECFGMAINVSLTPVSAVISWSARIPSDLVVLFLLFAGTIKVIEMDVAMQTTAQVKYPVSVVLGLGVVTLVIAVLFAIPRTSVLGAILLTGLLGGAIAAHVRVGSSIVTHTPSRRIWAWRPGVDSCCATACLASALGTLGC